MDDPEESQPEDTIPSLMMACIALAAEIAERNCDEEKDDLIREHIKKWEANPVPMVDFESGLEWFNVEKGLSLREDLQDCIVVLDFFTYCCINCMHILPDLENLEKVFPPTSGVMVVGVHSAKFDNERVSANINAAIERYGIHHAVVNDAQAKMWMELGITCWPTLLILGPNCEPIFVLVGEGHRERLEHYITLAHQYFSSKRKLLDICGLVKPSSHVDAQNLPLLYPGKVAVFPQGIIIADSGHHRMLIADKNGTVKHIVGSGKQGRADGPFHMAEFNTPQGVLFYPPHTIFVADTNNHLIRKVCLESQTVETVVGTGEQAYEKDLGGLPGKQQAISSPWDLCFGKSLDLSNEEEDNLLVIAMAGSHQIWAYFLCDGKWFKGSEHKAGTAMCLAGNGEEQNRNTRYPHSASFAQPSGVTWCAGSSTRDIFIADSESSTIRKLQLKDCVVKAVVGGARDPTDLFSFGDKDGCGVEAKLQHPLAVTAVGEAVYVADAYNHKIKVVRTTGKTYSITTIAGTGKIGSAVGNALESQFSEPSGMCVSSDQQLLYIADTNNHAIKVLQLKKGTVYQLPVSFECVDSKNGDLTDTGVSDNNVVAVILSGSGKEQVVLDVVISLVEGSELNLEAPSKWKLEIDGDVSAETTTGDLQSSFEIPVTVNLKPHSGEDDTVPHTTVVLKVLAYICLSTGVCVKRQCQQKLLFTVGSLGEEKDKDEQMRIPVVLEMGSSSF